MKRKIIFFLFSIIASVALGQAHIGCDYDELRRFLDYKPLKTGFLKEGYWYAESEMTLGKFVYCFSNSGYVVYCFQIPYNQGCVNAQAEILNQKYTITSDRSWVAYLSNGEIMYINLKYDEGFGQFIFTYQ